MRFPEIYLWWNPCLVELRTIECTLTKTRLRRICLRDSAFALNIYTK